MRLPQAAVHVFVTLFEPIGEIEGSACGMASVEVLGCCADSVCIVWIVSVLHGRVAGRVVGVPCSLPFVSLMNLMPSSCGEYSSWTMSDQLCSCALGWLCAWFALQCVCEQLRLDIQ